MIIPGTQCSIMLLIVCSQFPKLASSSCLRPRKTRNTDTVCNCNSNNQNTRPTCWQLHATNNNHRPDIIDHSNKIEIQTKRVYNTVRVLYIINYSGHKVTVTVTARLFKSQHDPPNDQTLVTPSSTRPPPHGIWSFRFFPPAPLPMESGHSTFSHARTGMQHTLPQSSPWLPHTACGLRASSSACSCSLFCAASCASFFAFSSLNTL